MPDREKVLKGLEICAEKGAWHGLDCSRNKAYKDCPYYLCETGCVVTIARDAIALLKEQEPVIPILRPSSKGVALHCGACDWKMIEVPDTLSYEYAMGKIFYCANCGRKVKWN